MKNKIIIYAVIIGIIIIGYLVLSLVILGQRNKNIKLKYELEQCQKNKNLTKQTNEKYLKELKNKEKLVKKLNYEISEIKGLKDEEINDNFSTLWNDML